MAIRYVPEDGYYLDDFFTYVFAVDGTLCSEIATVRIPRTARPYPRSEKYVTYGGDPVNLYTVPCGISRSPRQ